MFQELCCRGHIVNMWYNSSWTQCGDKALIPHWKKREDGESVKLLIRRMWVGRRDPSL
jgi:hypothetical protein